MKIPRTKVCQNHKAPFDFVYDAFTGKHKLILAKANRSGGKTINFAILDILFALANDKCEIANAAAIKSQTQRCYRYVQGFHNQNKEFTEKVVNSILSRTDYYNGSSLELLIATVSGVNSPHPQKFIADEVELFAWFILQQAMNMVKSKGNITGQTILGSTQKYVSGPMQRLINDSLATGKMEFYEWCCWDVMQKPTVEMMPLLKETFGDDLPENIMDADGFFSWEDLISTHALLDKEIWETEWLCKRPQSGGLVYPQFSESNIERNFVFDPRKIYLFEDCGYALDHPDVVLFAQVDQALQRVTIFDELYMSLKSTSKIMEEVKIKLQQYGLDFHSLNSWIVDPHMLTEQTDRFNLGAPIWGANMEWKVENPPLLLLKNSIPLVRKFIDERWLKITPNCVNLQSEFQLYSKVKHTASGIFKDEPEKMNDHGPDAVRYGLVRLFPSMAFASFQVTKPRAALINNPSLIVPITVGVMQKRF